MRSIKAKFPALRFSDNTPEKQSYRVIGSVDIDGKGRAHDLAAVDPFIFLDETCLRSDSSWPFPKHPHCGLVAMTYLLSGELRSWDNVHGTQPLSNRAGGLYYINSGRGIIHEEQPISGGDDLRWLQLWVNPGVSTSDLPVASTQLILPEQIPVYQSDEAIVRIVIGSAFCLQSPLNPDWPIQYLHVCLNPGASITLPIPTKTWQGFFYILQGSGQFGTTGITGKLRDCLVLGNEMTDDVEVSNNQGDVLEFVFLCGQAHQKSFYKLLSGGGALIAESEAMVRAAGERYILGPTQ